MDQTALEGFSLAMTEQINDVMCEFYKGRGFEGAITREKLGAALGYANPKKAIEKIHAAHRERMEARSQLVRWVSPNLGGTQDTMCYSLEGALEICRWSRQPAADQVMDALYAVFKKLLTAGSVSIDDLPNIMHKRIAENPDVVYETVIPALHESDVDKRKFLTSYLQISMDDLLSGAKLKKHLDANARAVRMLAYWKKHDIKIYTIDDLPGEYQRWFIINTIIKKIGDKPANNENIVFYNGKSYFDRTGLLKIINAGMPSNILTRSEAAEWMSSLTDEVCTYK